MFKLDNNSLSFLFLITYYKLCAKGYFLPFCQLIFHFVKTCTCCFCHGTIGIISVTYHETV